MTLSSRIQAVVQYLAAKTDLRPAVGLILGSGLGGFADTLENPCRVSFSEIPDFPQATVEGHAGAFVFGRSCGKPVVVLQGRLHSYEGHSQQELTMPVRVMAALGVKTLVLTNAAGGVNLHYRPADLMLIADHINYSGSNPLIGPNLEEFGPRFPDVSDLYTASLRRAIREKSEAAGIALQEGVYMMFSGPNYETPAEIRMARIVGADAVGMSTVPEALVAAHCGMSVVGVSCITNMAAGILPQKLSHTEVQEVADLARDKFRRLLTIILETV